MQMMTIKAAILSVVAAALATGFTAAAHAQALDQPVRTAQVQKKKAAKRAPAKRAPTRILVRPVLPYRLDSTEFPRNDNLGYPGPNAVRQCEGWLQMEHRPSGTVVTPQRRCWWVRG